MKWFFGIVLFLVLALLAWIFSTANDLENRNLRGSFTVSPDKTTYFVLAEDNGGGCGEILIDGEKWPFKNNVPGPIRAGAHQIQCGKGDSGISFEIPKGTVYRFDYWGP